MRKNMARLHLVLTWLFLALIVVQVYLAGLGLFDNDAGFGAHETLGFTALHLIPLVLLVLALVARMGRRISLMSLALFVAVTLQIMMVTAFRDTGPVAALHPVFALVDLAIGIHLAMLVRRWEPAATVPAQAPATAST